ncbi:hypothetical protein F511_15804 [Dorcoceras hygrometricum]|uniref:Uncharacterized protein n=1 Tax=Dorcoceras hygrometricum TaxID=472368 RepID=A0A2Z7DGU8_9LAMI|nr:hypothetical protein F511_15804 [Dorcoceras hygrometricum]
MSLFDLQDVFIAIGSIATLDLPMVVDLIGIYGLKGPYCTLTTTDWFLQALSVIPRGSWGDVARRFTMIRWAAAPSLPTLVAAAAVFAGKLVSGQLDVENPFVLISSGLLVQPDEGVSDLVVDRIGETTAIYREEPGAEVITTQTNAAPTDLVPTDLATSDLTQASDPAHPPTANATVEQQCLRQHRVICSGGTVMLTSALSLEGYSTINSNAYVSIELYVQGEQRCLRQRYRWKAIRQETTMLTSASSYMFMGNSDAYVSAIVGRLFHKKQHCLQNLVSGIPCSTTMASLFFVNSYQINFESVLMIPNHDGMLNMFKALEASDLRGFTEVLEETLMLGVSEAEHGGQGVNEAEFADDFAQWLDDFVARNTEPEIVESRGVTSAARNSGDIQEVDKTGDEEVDLVSSDVSTVYRSPYPIFQEVDSVEHDLLFALGPAIFPSIAQEERLYFVQSPDSSPAISLHQESSSSSTDVSMHFDSTDIPVNARADTQTSAPVDFTMFTDSLEDLRSSIFQRIHDSNCEILSKVNAVEFGVRGDLLKLQVLLHS